MKLTSESGASTTQKRQVLIVEDEALIAVDIQERLKGLGYEVLRIVDTGEDAIEAARQLHPHIILMDIQVMGQMNGVQAAKSIWNELQIPIVYVSAHSDEATLSQAKQAAPFGYVTKPVRDQDLRVAIEIAINRYHREQWLVSILKGVEDAVVVTDKLLQIQFMNGAAEQLSGWSSKEAMGRHIHDVLRLVDQDTQMVIQHPSEAALQQDRVVFLSENILLFSKDGRTSSVISRSDPLRDSQGETAGTVTVLRTTTLQDLTNEKRLALEKADQLTEENARLTEINRLKDDFLSLISHQIRASLSSIKMATRMLELSFGEIELLNVFELTGHSVNRYLEILNRMCEQESGLLGDLLHLQQIDVKNYPLRSISFEIEPWLRRLAGSLQPRFEVKQQELILNIAPHLSSVVADRDVLTRIFEELINHAISQSPSESAIVVNALDNEDWFELSVQLSGVEISPEELSKMFQPFYHFSIGIQDSERASQGLGLALVKRLVEVLRGEIQGYSAEGITTFRVLLPWRLDTQAT